MGEGVTQRRDVYFSDYSVLDFEGRRVGGGQE